LTKYRWAVIMGYVRLRERKEVKKKTSRKIKNLLTKR
jgi:hypothetical protein